MRVGGYDDRNVALPHLSQHFRAGIHFRNHLVVSRCIQLHRHTGRRNAIKARPDMLHGSLHLPLQRDRVLDQVRMRDAVEMAALRRHGQVLEVMSLQRHVAVTGISLVVLGHLRVHRADNVLEVRHIVELAEPGFHLRDIVALNSQAHVKTVGPGFGGVTYHRHVVTKFRDVHPRAGSVATGYWIVAREDDPLQASGVAVFGILPGLTVSVLAQRRVHM